MVNLKQIAAELSISVTTVSRALKDGPEVHPDTIVRVKEAANRLGYTPNHHGQALKTGKTRALAAVLPMETRDYLSDVAKLPLIEGMTLAAQEAGYSLSVYSTTPDHDPLESVQRLIQARGIDGLIITRMISADPRVALLKERDIPFVTFGRTSPEADYAFVDIDNEQIAFDATKRLIERGCRRIAIQLLVPEDRGSAMRVAGYERAMSDAGLAIDKELIGYGVFTLEASAVWFDHVLAKAAPPTGLLCANELGLLGALSAVRRRGIIPGQDIHIMSRDNTRLAQYLSAKIGIHSIDMADAGRRLVDLLVTQIENPASTVTGALLQGQFETID